MLTFRTPSILTFLTEQSGFTCGTFLASPIALFMWFAFSRSSSRSTSTPSGIMLWVGPQSWKCECRCKKLPLPQPCSGGGCLANLSARLATKYGQQDEARLHDKSQCAKLLSHIILLFIKTWDGKYTYTVYTKLRPVLPYLLSLKNSVPAQSLPEIWHQSHHNDNKQCTLESWAVNVNQMSKAQTSARSSLNTDWWLVYPHHPCYLDKDFWDPLLLSWKWLLRPILSRYCSML